MQSQRFERARLPAAP